MSYSRVCSRGSTASRLGRGRGGGRRGSAGSRGGSAGARPCRSTASCSATGSRPATERKGNALRDLPQVWLWKQRERRKCTRPTENCELGSSVAVKKFHGTAVILSSTGGVVWSRKRFCLAFYCMVRGRYCRCKEVQLTFRTSHCISTINWSINQSISTSADSKSRGLGGVYIWNGRSQRDPRPNEKNPQIT